MRASWSSVTTGVSRWIVRHELGWGSNRLPSGPTRANSEVMISSRIASSGGFVTWANSCWK